MSNNNFIVSTQKFLHSACATVENGINTACHKIAQAVEPLKSCYPTLKKIALIALGVIFGVTCTIPTLVGIAVGAIYKDQVANVIHKIQERFSQQPILGKVVLGLAGGICAWTFFPITALAFGAYAGSRLHTLTTTNSN